ncbi:conserved protein of unknown function (plasmid) [Rhodovastum atsumiense]|uniref:Uncharacterized protein n=1 Tax=Rhodovastum atsumiense TaxID=504468 RepID=A0A5M6IVK3_9PROT|nr:hypothetical protein [Rhodovastum atsumiense]KAA5611877.1 hypothetical protein F1189_12655 [Rhodovastum atsumiense]CAH2606144.1 conserved protein of unknown function [Rhodovastum atsumiense]
MADYNDSFDLGHQSRVVIRGDWGDLTVPNVTDFTADPVIDKPRVKRLEGSPIEKHVPMGFEGTITYSRRGSASDDWWAFITSGWWANGVLRNRASIFQYVTEEDGKESVFQFPNAAISLGKSGSWKPSSEVEQRIDFFAGDKIKVR